MEDDYSLYDNRLASFGNHSFYFGYWDMHQQSKDDLARAGFFYTGALDWVECFSCGLILRELSNLVHPAYLHAVYNPSCKHVESYATEEFHLVAADAYETIEAPRLQLLKIKPPFMASAEGNPTFLANVKPQEKKGKCLVCLQDGRAEVFLRPCNHLATCLACYNRLNALPVKTCPVCRTPVEEWFTVHDTISG